MAVFEEDVTVEDRGAYNAALRGERNSDFSALNLTLERFMDEMRVSSEKLRADVRVLLALNNVWLLVTLAGALGFVARALKWI